MAAICAVAAGVPSVAASSPRLDGACLRALGNRSGAVVILDVRSGRTLASVFRGVTDRPLPPGSVAKLVCAHAGLVSGRVPAPQRFTCRNALTVNGRILHCTAPGGHGTLDMPGAIAQSCNIWFYQAARKTGAPRIMRSWREFGISRLPSAADVKSVERLAVGEEGVRVTCADLAGLARRIALNKSVPGSACATLAKGMRLAVTDGTARQLAALPVKVSGKTGSPEHTQNPSLRHGWFVGYAPSEHPEIAFAVFCQEGNAYRSAVPVTFALLQSIYGKGGR